MKKHLFAALCVTVVATLPGCFGCCDRTEKKETVEVRKEVDAADIAALPVDTNVTDIAPEVTAETADKH